jgi:hypothetical protein
MGDVARSANEKKQPEFVDREDDERLNDEFRRGSSEGDKRSARNSPS